MVTTTLTMQDIVVPPASRPSGKDLVKDSLLPFIILPVLLLIATISYTVTIIIMVAIGMGVLYVYSRPRQKNRSPFFFSWTLSSCATLFIVFDFAILRCKEITKLENAFFLILLTCTCYFFYKMKKVAQSKLGLGPSKGKEYSPVITSESKYCHICQLEVNERYFHSIWWDCCVFRPNYRYFLAGNIFALAVLIVGVNFGLTTICHPYVLYGPILMPDDCSGAYDHFWHAISFVSCLYAIGYILVIAFVLLRQIFVFIPKYFAPQWRRLVNVLNV